MSRTLGDVLVRAGIIDEVQLAAGLSRQKQWGGHLLTQLVRARMVEEERLVTGLARRFSHESLHPLPLLIEKRVLDLLPPEYCSRYLLLPVAQLDDGTVRLAVADPTDLAAVDAVRTQVGHSIEVVVGGPEAIADAVQSHYYGAPPRTTTNDLTAGGADDFGIELPPESDEDATAPFVGQVQAVAAPVDVPVDVPVEGIELDPAVEADVVAPHEVLEVGDLLGPGEAAAEEPLEAELVPDAEVTDLAEPATAEEVDTDRVPPEAVDVSEGRTATAEPDDVDLIPEPEVAEAACPDDIPTAEPPPEAMPTTVMSSMARPGSPVDSTDGHLIMVAAEPVGGRAEPEEAEEEPTPGTAPDGQEVTADFPAGGRSVTCDDPVRGPDESPLEERLARAEQLARETRAELRDLVTLLVERDVFSRNDYKAWRGKKW